MHQDQSGFDVNKWIQKSEERQRNRQNAHKRMPFKDYLTLLKDQTWLAQNAHARLVEVIESYGVEAIPEHERPEKEVDKRYLLFSRKLFGLEKPIFEFVNFLKGGAMGSSTGKQIVLWVGPPASGKSTLANILKKALEDYCKEHIDRLPFGIVGCPIREQPLHLLPRTERDVVARELGVSVWGDLCPICRDNLKTNYKAENNTIRWWDMEVETFDFSVQARRGIGSYEPTEEKTASVSDLVGKENIAITGGKEDGYNDPRAFDLKSGELGKANRGLFEGRELIKVQQELMWVFLSVAEEKEMKVQGSAFPQISLDTVLIGHTNLTEFIKFSSKPENEALHDRIYTIHFPYPLRVKDEIRVYNKLITEESDFKKLSKCHIAPGALDLAALFAVMTRLVESKVIELLIKAKLYNGDRVLTEVQGKELEQLDLNAIIAEGQNAVDINDREGMFGVSSRDVLSAINSAIVKHGNGCLTHAKMIKALREFDAHRMGYSAEDIKRYQELLTADEKGSVVTEYNDLARGAVEQAFLRTYGDIVDKQYDKYIYHARLDRRQHWQFRRDTGTKECDEITGQVKKADTEFLHAVEAQMGYNEEQGERFRSEVLQALGMGIEERDPILLKAIENKLLDESQDFLQSIVSDDGPQGKEEQETAKNVFAGLLKENFCKVCAKEVLERARELLK